MRRLKQALGDKTVAAVRLGTAIAVLGVVSMLAAVLHADPPEGQTYIGAKKCASCHFEQYMSWKKTKHAQTYLILPEKYKTDPTCLPCHTTGYGEPTGFKDVATTPALAGNTCEMCHGPGSKHEETAKPFAKVKTLTKEQDALVRGTIWRVKPQNICIECHKVQAHGKRVPYDKD